MLTTITTLKEEVPRQFDYWREQLFSTFVGMGASAPHKRGFEGCLAGWGLSHLSLTIVTADPHRIARTRRDISRDSGDWLFVNLQLEGEARTTQLDESRLAQPGDIVFVDARQPYSIEMPQLFSLMCIKVPYSAMIGQVRDYALGTTLYFRPPRRSRPAQTICFCVDARS